MAAPRKSIDVGALADELAGASVVVSEGGARRPPPIDAPSLPGISEAETKAMWERYPHIISESVESKPWQLAAYLKSLTQRHFALFLEQGLGKTKTAIDRAFTLWAKGSITGVLVFSLKGVHRQWVREQLPTHAPKGMEYEAVEWPVKALPPSLGPGNTLCWFAMNIDAISASKNGMAMAMAFIKEHAGRVLIIIDESHTIKNPRSERSKAARRLGRLVSHRMILTGTPLSKSLEEEWAQLLWLDPAIIGIEYVTVFRREYCVMGGFENKEVIGHRNVERWRKLTEPYIYHFTKAQAGMEAKMYDRWHFDLKKEQRDMIRSLKKGLLADIRSGVVASAANAAVAVMRINQVASGFITDIDGNLQRLFSDPRDNPRIANLLELIDAREGKIAIWARFTDDIEQIMSVLGEAALRYDGTTKDKDREEAKRRFTDLSDPVRFFVANPKAGGTGLNLQGACNSAIYYSHVDGAIPRWQSEDRIHRLGTIGVVQYTDMVAAGSFDARILQTYKDGRSVYQMAMPEIIQWLESE